MRRTEQEKSKKSVIKIVIIAVIALIILAVLSVFIWYKVSTSPVNKNDNQEKEIVIPIGTGANGIATILKENNIIKSETAFKLYVRLENISNLQAGTYRLKPSMELKEITELLKTGKIEDTSQFNITYIEGKNINWLANLIEEKTNNSKEDVFSLLEDEEYIGLLIEKYWFLEDVIKGEDIYYPLEGYLFPDTYTIANKDVKPGEIFEMMLDQTENILEEYKEEIQDSDFSVHEILTMASIIEMESMSDEGRKGVSSVIYNRLDRGMAIQSDVTTYYAFKVDVGERELYQAEIDKYNPYNTRGPNMEGKLPVRTYIIS